jgi:alpha-ribazole phosphatase/probable phosphoglycerate mutase
MTIDLPPAANGTTRLILLRHGEPDAAVRGRCYGQLDPGLSAHGREQMQRAWRLLASQTPGAIYSSPRRRAIEGATLRADNSPAIRVEDRLREIDFGAFEGLTYEEIASRYPDTYAQWMTEPAAVVFPGGESFEMLSARVCAALDEIRRTHPGETVAVVSHGGVNRIALREALHLDRRHVFRLAQAYACVNVIDYLGDEPMVVVMNACVKPC